MAAAGSTLLPEMRGRALEEEHLATLRTALPHVPLQEVPLGEEDVVGPAALERFSALL